MKNIVIAFFLFLSLASCSNADSSKKKDNSPLAVTTVYPQQESINQLVSTGQVVSSETARLGTRIMGYVDKVHVKQGEKVKKGELLISLSDNELVAQELQAKAMLRQADQAYQVALKDSARYQEMLTRGSVSLKEFENVQLQYQGIRAKKIAAQQQLHAATAQRAYTQIVAPYAGTVVHVAVDEGSLATPGMPLVTLEQSARFVIHTQLNEAEITRVEKGMSAAVVIESAQLSFAATIVERSASSVSTGGHYNVTLTVPDTIQQQLLSGMRAIVTFQVASKVDSRVASAILIPTNTLIYKGGLVGVYVVTANQQALLRWLRIGSTNGENTEVLSGLSVTDQVIVPAQHRLSNGLSVQTIQKD